MYRQHMTSDFSSQEYRTITCDWYYDVAISAQTFCKCLQAPLIYEGRWGSHFMLRIIWVIFNTHRLDQTAGIEVATRFKAPGAMMTPSGRLDIATQEFYIWHQQGLFSNLTI